MRVLLTGASGQLGAYMLRAAPACELIAWSHTTSGMLGGFPLQSVDLTDASQVGHAFAAAAPDFVVHSAAISKIDRCYRDPQLAERVNVEATRQLAQLSAARGARLLYISTDMVFDGEKGAPYREDDSAAPTSIYGQSKLRGEQCAQEFGPAAVARISLLVGPAQHRGESFFDFQWRALQDGKPLNLFIDEWRTPLDYPTAAAALWAFALSGVTGVVHFGGPERLSRWDIGRQLADLLKADHSLLHACRQAEVPAPEKRPRDLSLDSSRWRILFPHIPWRPWVESIKHLIGGNSG